MKNAIRVKGIDFKSFHDSLFKTKWSIKDLPFSLRVNDLENVNLEHINISFKDDIEKVLFLDKVFILNDILLHIKEENLRHLNIILNPTFKKNLSNSEEDLVSDIIIIRHNRLFLIQFAYSSLSNTQYINLKPTNIKYNLNAISQIIKLKLPEDTMLQEYLFTIKESYIGEISRSIKKIENFFSKTTNRELLKLFE